MCRSGDYVFFPDTEALIGPPPGIELVRQLSYPARLGGARDMTLRVPW
jgi:hypothetical protein